MSNSASENFSIISSTATDSQTHRTLKDRGSFHYMANVRSYLLKPSLPTYCGTSCLMECAQQKHQSIFFAIVALSTLHLIFRITSIVFVF